MLIAHTNTYLVWCVYSCLPLYGVCLRERFHSCAIVCSMEPAVFYAFNQLTHNGEHTLIELVSMKPNIALAFETIGNTYKFHSLTHSFIHSLACLPRST